MGSADSALCYAKSCEQIFLPIVAGQANPLLHLVEVLGEGAATRCGEAVLGTWDATFEEFDA